MIHAIIRGRNCQKYIATCLRSIAAQKYTDWHAHISLDDPTDKSEDAAKSIIQRLGISSRCTLKTNKRHQGLSKNLYRTLQTCGANSNDICAIVDADDFIHKGTFRYINKLYERKPSILLTYGSYIKLSKGRRTRISRVYKKEAQVRKAKWHASHLKTFKFKLFRELPEEYVKDEKGEWLPAASDLAIMMGLIEMAGLDQCKYVEKLCYYWRDDTPYKTDRKLQLKCEKIIRAKKPLKRIDV